MNERSLIVVQNSVHAFHNLMIDILRRRILFRSLESNLASSGAPTSIQKNPFVSFYIMDYTRGQLIDLRKFFDTDPLSYKISELLDLTTDGTARGEFRKIKKIWNKKFRTKVNKVIAHFDKDFRNFTSEVKKIELDALIDDINAFLDILFEDLKETIKLKHKAVLIYNNKFRDSNGIFLNSQHNDEFAKYLRYACSNGS